MSESKITGIIAAVVIAAFIGLLIWLGSSLVSSGALNTAASYEPSQPVPETKPITKTRCDYTGFMAPQMIEEEAQQGYFYTGRVTTFWCEDAMVFQLREVK